MTRQQTVKIFLSDGSPNGVLIAEIGNWTGSLIVAPRSKLPELVDRQEAHRTGVYLLSGNDPEGSGRQLVYVGEADNIFKRLQQHNRDDAKDFWERTAIITSKDGAVTKAHGRYLESRLIQIGNSASSARVVNSTNPDPISLPETDCADMEFFIEQLQILLPIVGFSFAVPLPALRESNTSAEESPLFEMKYSGVVATAREVDGEFIVLKGSSVRSEVVSSARETTVKFRESLLHDGKLAASGSNGVMTTTEDLVFSSPSAAAKFIGGASLNGRIIWKVKDSGHTYAEWQEQKLTEIR